MVGAPDGLSAEDMQAIADYVKLRLLGDPVVPEEDEAETYDPRLCEFVGKLTTLRVIPAAIDYWGRQVISESTTGTSEVMSFPERRDQLWKIFEQLQRQVAAEWDEVGIPLPGGPSALPRVSYGDNGRGVLITNDVYETMTSPLLPRRVSDLVALRGVWQAGEPGA
jgi:hypothetical protein